MQDIVMQGANIRKRRTHKKSRAGCGNCKLRRVKCDEGKPECNKCLGLGVCCNYDSTIPDLQPRYAMSQSLNGKVQSYNTWMHSGQAPTLEFTLKDVESLEIFQIRTMITLMPSMDRVDNNIQFHQLILKHMFLRHVAQSVTFIHNRYLSSKPGRRTAEEIYHWTKGISLFNQKLSSNINPADRDAIWGAASVLIVIMMASVEGSSPEESWPLQGFMAAEPEWLTMSHGKHAIWSLVQPDRPDSIWRFLFEHMDKIFPVTSFADTPLEEVWPVFIKLFELDSRLREDNAYYIPALTIHGLITAEPRPERTRWVFFQFSENIKGEFGRLVSKKDPRALLLMAFWYSRLRKGDWWLRRRALLEGQATCLYLERYHAYDKVIQQLLEGPKEILFRYEDGEQDKDIFGLVI
ncbi:hypothetical protein BT63DRAFT_482780 [Microthyrium microscopicum]|uniref:Zn(2)-C6 fungal-type domain-containing protein n=1 Tax=Microthyrium microscopicum TaxID=703497 RepID=A0A6A6U0U7_9PEZI|nr:hypothetical protein BT63DRAFT_482780 [Microthyrium microscopicum]